MSTLHAAAEATVDASVSTVMAVLRDYHGKHREILPPAFTHLVVEEGGFGAGTVIAFDVTLGGRTQRSRARIEEPAPGVIEEHLIGREMVTTFTVLESGEYATTRIETRWEPARGIAGLMERLVAPRMLRRLYLDELANLSDVVRAVSLETATVPG